MTQAQTILEAITQELAPIIERAVEAYEMSRPDSGRYTKTVYTTEDIMERYGVSKSTAQKFIREAKYLSNGAGGKLCKGKLLWTELAVWEEKIGNARR